MATNIIIDDDVCWLCGNPFTNEKGMNRTTHHTLSRHLKPKKNITVPIHQKCHDEITSVDMSALTAFAYRLQKETTSLNSKVGGLINLLYNQTMIKIKNKRENKNDS